MEWPGEESGLGGDLAVKDSGRGHLALRVAHKDYLRDGATVVVRGLRVDGLAIAGQAVIAFADELAVVVKSLHSASFKPLSPATVLDE
jgi:hypothetical protein